MRLFRDDAVADWVAARIPGASRGFGDCVAFGVEHGGKIVAGAVFHNWSPEWRAVEMSAAADDRRWMTRKVVSGLLGYGFEIARTIYAQHETDSPARSIWLRLGAVETIIPGLRDGRDNVVATLTAEQAGRFHGQG